MMRWLLPRDSQGATCRIIFLLDDRPRSVPHTRRKKTRFLPSKSHSTHETPQNLCLTLLCLCCVRLNEEGPGQQACQFKKGRYF